MSESDIGIRQATKADLSAVWDVVYEHEVGSESASPPRGDVPSFLRHELTTGEMLVAERGDRVVGFASLITRGEIAYLAELFVRPDQQSAGIGKALLQRILPVDKRIRCTLSSTDPRALALYVRNGMRPQWPNVWLRATANHLGTLPGNDVELIEAESHDPELVRWDMEIGGRERPIDHTYWIEDGAIPVWFERHGRRVGYGYLQTKSGSAIWSRDAITVGPLGVRSAEDAAACVCRAVESARSQADIVRLAMPGPHPGLGPLLNAGFRLTYVETFVSTAAAAFVSPERYVGSGDFF